MIFKVEKVVLVLIAVVLFFSSCDITQKITSSVKPAEVKDLQLFKPFSIIKIIEKRNDERYNEEASKKSQRKIINSLKDNKVVLPITDEVEIRDTVLEMRMNLEIAILISKAFSHKKKDILHITPVLDSILEARGKRFGLIVLADGFGRTTENYNKEVAKGVAVGVLTLGTVYTSPIKCGSTIHAMIVDAQNNDVAFYRVISDIGRHPLNDKVLKDQIFRMFNGYFYRVKVD